MTRKRWLTRNKQEIKGVLCLILLFVVIIGNCVYIQGEILFYYFPGNHAIWKLFTLVSILLPFLWRNSIQTKYGGIARKLAVFMIVITVVLLGIQLLIELLF